MCDVQCNRNDKELFVAAQMGDKEAREFLVEKHKGLVISTARRISFDAQEDLHQAGFVGLLRAIEGFDTGRGAAFSTYAVPIIIEEMRTHLQSMSTTTISRRTRQLVRRFEQRQYEMAATRDRSAPPSMKEVAEDLGFDTSEIELAREAIRAPVNLDDAEYLSELISDSGNYEDGVTINYALSNLPEKEKYIVVMHFFHDRTQSEIAEELGVSQAQVSRLEKKALSKMKEHLRSS